MNSFFASFSAFFTRKKGSVEQIETLVNRLRPLAQEEYLRDSSIALLLESLKMPIEIEYEPHVQLLRRNYEDAVLAARKDFYDNIESNPLTTEQRLAVVRNNDRNLVLAAAGTGKTSVIVAKVLDLIDRGKAAPTDILVLAYNTAAASELRTRLSERAKQAGLTMPQQPDMMTFHALGRLILQKIGTPTQLSVFVHDALKREMWLSTWLIERLKTDKKALLRFIEISTTPTRPFHFTSKNEYQSYTKDTELRSLQDEIVDSDEELFIANWLFLHSINYLYKPSPRAVSKPGVRIVVNQRANFYLIGAITKRECLYKIKEGEKNEARLEKKLQNIIKKVGLITNLKPTETLFQTLNNNGFILEGVKRYLKCLQAIRTEQLNEEAILERLQFAKIPKAKLHAAFLNDMMTAYRVELLRQKAIDFDDMILRSIEALETQQFFPKWTQILIDEFQDISGARMQLINALITQGPQPHLTAVGDDWQAIYRFAGGKLELTTQFDRLVGSNTKTMLQKTFRYNNSIAEVAGAFVMQNPEQFKKQIETHHQVTTPQVYLLDSRTAGNGNQMEHRAFQVINTIRKNDANGSIAILARYRYLLNNTKNTVESTHKENIHYWTFHGAKGLEADYCVLLGFTKGKMGFPSQRKEDALLEALLPSLDAFPHSEERRLFYVALTRAKKKTYVIADSTAPSLFVNELLVGNYPICVDAAFERLRMLT